MQLFQINATGPRAIGVLAVVVVLYVVFTGSRFSRTCARLDGYADQIKTDITAREMRHMVRDIRDKSISELNADPTMANRVDQLHVGITEFKCADTFVLGIVCRVTYHLGTADDAGPERQNWFSLRQSGTNVGWFDVLGPRRQLFNISPRNCSKVPDLT